MPQFIPPAPGKIAIPAVLASLYLTAHGTSAPFTDVQSRLSPSSLRTLATIWRVLVYAHLGESAFAFLRALVAKKRPFGESVQWALATLVWGFGSIQQQVRQFP